MNAKMASRLALLLFCTVLAGKAQPQTKPNILILISDDQGYSLSSFV
jgi:hypothetical protein